MPTGRTASASPPDWDSVPFDVHCARCGRDLRGLTDPVCPACALEFDWSLAVPIEHLTCNVCDYPLRGLTNNRCPECGTEFTWDEAVASFHRKRVPLFEYHWRERPIRSFAATVLRPLRPGRFWRMLDIHDTPRRKPLLLTSGVLLSAFALSVTLCCGLAGILFDVICAAAGWKSWGVPAPGTPAGRALASLSSPANVYRAFADGIGDPALVVGLLFGLAWCVCSLLALLIFQQSMRRGKVRSMHVIRVWTYAVLCPALWAPVVMLIGVVLHLIGYAFGVSGLCHVALYQCGIPLLVLFATYGVYRAYRSYLLLPHSAAIAISSQLITMIASIAVCATILGDRFLFLFC